MIYKYHCTSIMVSYTCRLSSYK